MIDQTKIARLIVATMTAGFLWWGIIWIDVPPVYRLARSHNMFLFYQGYILIVIAVLIAWFHHLVEAKLLWIAEKIHRFISVLIMLGVVWTEGAMHIFNIPHMEGWWISLLGGSTFITGFLAYISKWQKKSEKLNND